MNFRSLKCFLAAVEEMNFSRAAERLYISQQALSSHIKRLEDAYGVVLFERRPSLHLTLAGENMVFFARQILQCEAQMEAGFADISDNCKGRLNFGISRLRSQVFFPDIWKTYHQKCPNIDISLADGTTREFEELLQEGKIDLYVGVDIPPRPNVTTILLAEESLYCYFHENLLREYYPETWEADLSSFRHGIDLLKVADLPFIMLSRENRLRKALTAFLNSNGLQPHVIMDTNHQDLVFRMCRDGYGIGPISPMLLYQTLRSCHSLEEGFHAFPVTNEIPANRVCLAYRSDYPLPRYVLELIETVRDVFALYTQSIRRIMAEQTKD